MNRKDLAWVIPVLGFYIVTLWLWSWFGLMILTVGIIGILIAIFLLAGQRQLFASCPQMGAMGQMYGTGEAARLQRMIIVDEKGSKAEDSQGNPIEPLWFEKKLNIWWLGIPFLGRIHEFELSVVKEEREETTEKGQTSVKIVRKLVKKKFYFISLAEEIYTIIIPPVLCADNFDVVLDVALYTQVVSPRKALFSIGNFLKAVIVILEMYFRAKVGTLSLDKLREQKAELAEEIFAKLQTDKEIERMRRDWGINLKKIGLRDVTPESAAAEVIKEKAFQKVKADAKIETARGEKQYHIAIGEGLAQKYKLIAGIEGGLGVDLRRLDVFEVVGASPATKIISFPEFTQALSSMSGKDTKSVAAFLSGLGMSPENFQKILEELLKKKGGP